MFVEPPSETERIREHVYGLHGGDAGGPQMRQALVLPANRLVCGGLPIGFSVITAPSRRAGTVLKSEHNKNRIWGESG
jgi:hypothetical protein